MSTALVLGATGLVGRHVLRALLHDPYWRQVRVLGRRSPDIEHARLAFDRGELDELDRYAGHFAVDAVFCCLGSTLAKAGSRAAFYRVDHDACVRAATLARDAGCPRFLMISAVNANPRGLSFYARTKGEAERDIVALGLPTTIFMQPSLLEGARSEHRVAEEAGQAVFRMVKPLVSWSGASWLSVPASDVADAMAALGRDPNISGVRRVRYRDIRRNARIQQQRRGVQ